MLILPLFLCLILSACCLSHSWEPATCTAPKTCSKCGETEGEALGHTFADATCTAPKTCTVCGETEGKALGHKTEWEVTNVDWISLKKQLDGKCTVCGAVEKDSEEIDSLIADGVFLFDGKEFTDRLQSVYDKTNLFLNLSFRYLRYENGLWATHIYLKDSLVGLIFFADENNSAIKGEDTHGISRIFLMVPYDEREDYDVFFTLYEMVADAVCTTVDPSIFATEFVSILNNRYADESLRGLFYSYDKVKDIHMLNLHIWVDK